MEVTPLPGFRYWHHYSSSGLLHGLVSYVHKTLMHSPPHKGAYGVVDDNNTWIAGTDGALNTYGSNTVGYNHQSIMVGSNTAQDSEAEAWHNLFRNCGMFIIIAIGVCGNILSFFTFGTCHLGRTPPGIYIIALSIVDTLVLFVELYIHIDLNSGKSLDGDDAACRIIYYLRYVFKLASALLVVAVAIERFILVVFPLKHNAISTTKTTMVSIAAISVTSFSLCAYAIFTLGVTPEEGCCIVKDKSVIYTVMDLMVSVGLGEVFASMVIFVLTGIIVRTLTSATKWRRNTVTVPDTLTHKGQPGSRTQKQVTVMLLSVAIAFIALRLPYTVIWFVMYMYGEDKISDAFINVFYVISVLNYSINFFLYCITGEAVRKRLWDILHCRMPKTRRESNSLSQHEMLRLRIGHGSTGRVDTCHTLI